MAGGGGRKSDRGEAGGAAGGPAVVSPVTGGNSPDLDRARNIGIGCFATFVGFWSGGMVGVLIGKFVGSARKCVPVEGLPACDWWWYAGVGMLLGAVTLPILVRRRMRRGSAPSGSST